MLLLSYLMIYKKSDKNRLKTESFNYHASCYRKNNLIDFIRVPLLNLVLNRQHSFKF